MFTANKTMTAGEFLVFFNPIELVKLLKLNKASYYLMQEIVNFEVLFKTQGIIMTPAQVEVTKKSATDALQVAMKYILLKSFIISKTIIAKSSVKFVDGAVRVPEVQELANLTVKELINLTNLTIKKVEWTAFIS